ncbi:hypothetical protein ES703_111759 [subsurface metagenome]
MNTWWLRLVTLVLAAISGPLRDSLVAFAKDFREKARQTPNPWDDFAADIICWLLGIS